MQSTAVWNHFITYNLKWSMNEMETDDGGRRNIVDNAYNRDTWLRFTGYKI